MRWAVCLAALVSVALPAGATVIEMKRDVETEGNIIRLGDLARVDDAVPEVAQALSGIYVSLSPAPGEVKTVMLAEVRHRLGAHGVNLGAVVFQGPTTTTVRRGRSAATRPASAPAPAAALLDLVARFAAVELGREAADLVVTLDEGGAARAGAFAAQSLRVAVLRGPEPLHLGENTLVLVGYAGAEARARVTVRARIAAYAAVPVAARRIARQERVAPDDVRVERRLVDGAGGPLLAVPEVAGRSAARAIPAGATIEPTMLVNAPLVKRNDLVTVIARARHIEVKTVAVALEDGAEGQVIQMRAPETRKVFAGRVAGARTVVLDITQEGGGR